MGKSYSCLLFILFSFRMASAHSTRSKKTSADKLSSVLPLKKTSKTKKKSVVNVVDVEETRAPSPELSQSDLARKKLAALMAAGEVAEAKRLKDRRMMSLRRIDVAAIKRNFSLRNF